MKSLVDVFLIRFLDLLVEKIKSFLQGSRRKEPHLDLLLKL